MKDKIIKKDDAMKTVIRMFILIPLGLLAICFLPVLFLALIGRSILDVWEEIWEGE
jgi:hypothetical protein